LDDLLIRLLDLLVLAFFLHEAVRFLHNVLNHIRDIPTRWRIFTAALLVVALLLLAGVHLIR
jgi:hypothetical protein